MKLPSSDDKFQEIALLNLGFQIVHRSALEFWATIQFSEGFRREDEWFVYTGKMSDMIDEDHYFSGNDRQSVIAQAFNYLATEEENANV